VLKISIIEDARGSCYPDPIDLNTPCMAKEVHIRGNPTAMKKLPKVVRGFVVATNDDSQDRCKFLPSIIPMNNILKQLKIPKL
jgi:hypothetical protein